MSNACPVSNETVDERAARLCALLVLAPLASCLLVASPWPALFLAVDFGLRGLGGRRYSPMARVSQWLIARLGSTPRRTNAAPKAFAARLGLGFSLAVTAALLVDQVGLAMFFAAPFAMCALLEGAFGYCVGCRIYQAWQRVRGAGESLHART